MFWRNAFSTPGAVVRWNRKMINSHPTPRPPPSPLPPNKHSFIYRLGILFFDIASSRQLENFRGLGCDSWWGRGEVFASSFQLPRDASDITSSFTTAPHRLGEKLVHPYTYLLYCRHQTVNFLSNIPSNEGEYSRTENQNSLKKTFLARLCNRSKVF